MKADRRSATLWILLPLLFGVTACIDFGEPRVAGQWSGTGVYEQGTRVLRFDLTLAQDGAALSGQYDIQREGRRMHGALTGTVRDGNLEMTMGLHGDARGRVEGNTMTLVFFEPGFGGGPGRSANVTLTRQ